MGLINLPAETLLDIFKYSCTSQESYLVHLLVNAHLHSLVKLDALARIPVRINAESVRFFHRFVTELGMGQYVKSLWINAGPTQAILVNQAIRACEGLNALACAMSAFVELCTPPEAIINAAEPIVKHTHTALTDLTLFGSLGLCSVLQIMHSEYPMYVGMLCAQITHLRVHDLLSSDFTLASKSNAASNEHRSREDSKTRANYSEVELPNLTHVAVSLPLFGGRARTDPRLAAQRLCKQLQGRVKVERIVVSVNHWEREDPPSELTLEVLEIDTRLRLVFLGEGLDEFEMWCARARGDGGIWDVETSYGRSIV